MINLKKDENGIININNLNVNIDAFNPFRGNYKFVKDNQLYYFKVCDEKETFREVFACEFADKFNIEHAKYDIGILDGNMGALSTSVHDIDEEYVPLNVIAKKLHVNAGYANTIETMDIRILPALCFSKKQEELSKYIRMFIFDILLANDDRHEENTGFIKKGRKFRIAPIFDNGFIASDFAIENHSYSEGISNKKSDEFRQDVIQEFFQNKKYAKYLAEELEKLSFMDLCSLVEDINRKYPYKFNEAYEQTILKELERNINTLNECKEYYYHPKRLTRG
jgi:hypothetical protein